MLRYGAAGIVNTVVGYSTYLLLLAAGINYTVALTIGTVAGVISSYFINRYWTFKSSKRIHTEFPKFLTVYGVSYLINLGLLVLFVEQFKMDKRIAQLIILVFITCITFAGNKFWSFNQSRTNKDKGEN